MGTTKSKIPPGSKTVETGGEDTTFVTSERRLTWNHWLEKGSNEKYADFLDSVLESLPYPFYVIEASDLTVKMANSAAQFGRLSEASTCYALTHMADRPCDSAEHPCPVNEIKRTKRPLTVEHVHYDKGGNPRHVEIHAFPVLDDEGNVSQIIEYVLDITERKQAEEALKWELAVNSALAKLYEPLISPEASMATIARIVLEQAKALTGSVHGYVSEIEPTTGDNILHTLTGMLEGKCEISCENRRIVFPRGKDGLYPTLCGHSLNSGKGFYTNSPAEHQASTGIPGGHVPINRFLSVPVMLAAQLAGQIALANKEGDYTEKELKAICRLSELYALAIQRKRGENALLQAHEELERRVEERTVELAWANEVLVKEITERKTAEESLRRSEKTLRHLSSQLLKAQESERKKIAGEIHDTVGHTLALLKISVESAVKKGGAAVCVESLETVLPMVQDAIEKVRTIQTSLRPAMLDELGILATIGWFCRELEKIYPDLRIDKEFGLQEKDVPEHLKIVIFRIAQEALNNVAKHANADLVHFSLTKTDDTIKLAIEDNGLGTDFDSNEQDPYRSQIGVSNMKERVELSGGSFMFESSKGAGTAVRAEWPS